MLKIKDKHGNVKFILYDEGTQPKEVNKVTKNVLKDLGEMVEDTDEGIDPSDLSQDDVKYILGKGN